MDSRLPFQRRIANQDEALAEAVRIFRTDLSIPKVIVADTDTHRRVITVYGDRQHPTIDYRTARRAPGFPRDPGPVAASPTDEF